jgi:PRC-barrel domain
MRLVLATTAVAAAIALAAPAFVLAQGTPQTVQLTKVDVIKVATGYRASKVIGASVVNEANDTVGKVDDIIIGQDGKSNNRSCAMRRDRR